MKTITVNTVNGTRTLTAVATEQWNRWSSIPEGCGSISTDHPMIRHSPKPLPWAHPGTHKLCFPTAGIARYCRTWGEYRDALGQPPSPDHYFVGS